MTVLEEAEVTSGETALVEATMVEGSYRLNPIVVSVSRTEEKALETPSAVEVIQTATSTSGRLPQSRTM